MRLTEEIEQGLIHLSNDRGVYLEGNIVKLIETDNEDFKLYLTTALNNDKDNRRKRLQITKQVQKQNKELQNKQEENHQLMEELKQALEQAENAKNTAVNDLDILQKKTQFELIGRIVEVALWIIIGVGVLTTVLFMFAMLTGRDTTLLGNTWSNLFGILLTNSFSIIGTIMGVKYASENKEKIK